MRRRTVLVVAILVTSLGFALGRLTAVAGHATAPSAGATNGATSTAGRGDPSRIPDADPALRQAGVALRPRDFVPERRAAQAPGGSGTPTASTATASPLHCDAQLEQVTAQLAELERQRKSRDGEPIPPSSDSAPRFQERPLLHTFQSAFRATGIAGRVDTVDCVEFPCIVFGRVQGDEELVARLEDSRPFAAYDEDIGVMLTWASGDHARGHAPKRTGDRSKPSEISLFAFAFYSPDDRRRLGEALDRRIRARTTDLWNALGPDDP